SPAGGGRTGRSRAACGWSAVRAPPGGAYGSWPNASDPLEPAAGRGRVRLREPDPLELRKGRGAVPGRLQLGNPLRRQLVGVLLLDPLEPLRALGGLRVLELGAPAGQGLVDLHEQLVHQALLRDLPQRLALSEDQALVLCARDP